MHRTTIVKYTKFSAEELQKSVSDPLSCVAAVQSNEILSLRPRDCEHIVKGVRRCVTDKIGRYNPLVNGIVLGYAKVRIENALSALRQDSPFLHVRATIDYYVFQPRLGSTLRGTVNYVSKEFVSAMIYRVFNVTVKLGLENVRKRRTITKGSEIAFIVKSCDMKSEIPVIEGDLVAANEEARVEGEQEQEQPTTPDESVNGIVKIKEEPKSPEKPTKSRHKKSDSATVTNGHSPPVPMQTSESDEEKNSLIQSVLDEMFGLSKSGKRKNKSKSNKSNTSVGEVPIKQEEKSPSREEPSTSRNRTISNFTSNTKQNGKNVLPNGSSTPFAQTETSQAKKRKLRFDLSDVAMQIKEEPTEEKKRRKTYQ